MLKYKDLDKAIDKAVENRKKLKESYDRSCENGDHGIFLEHIGFWNGYIHYRCRNCGLTVSDPDRYYSAKT